jgi:hypothetical protein
MWGTRAGADADRVAVVEDGVISDFGSQDDLVEAGGSYAALWAPRTARTAVRRPKTPHRAQGR